MNKTLSLSGILLAVAILAASVSAHGPGGGWGSGYHMMDPGAMGPNYNQQYGYSYGNLTEEQRRRLEQMDREFYGDMSVLQNQLWEKINKRDAFLDSPEPDFDEVKILHKEIRDIQVQMNEMQSNYEREMQELIPDGSYGSGQGGRGYGGSHMEGYGHMMGDGYPMGGGGMGGYRR
jgi:Spy/CpxP family protein refolding chaperone